jgi:hypothetical protein
MNPEKRSCIPRSSLAGQLHLRQLWCTREDDDLEEATELELELHDDVLDDAMELEAINVMEDEVDTGSESRKRESP